MKTKILLAVAVISAASLSAQAEVHFGVSFGLPLPVWAYSAPVCAPSVVVAAPACLPPALAPACVPASPCPGPGYSWTTGYWSAGACGRVWVPGAWRCNPDAVVVGCGYGGYGYGRGYADGGYGYGRDGGCRWGHGDDRRDFRDGGYRR